MKQKTTLRGTRTNRTTPRYLRKMALLVVSLLVAATAVLGAAPQADAQTDDSSELRFGFPDIAVSCEDGFTIYPTGITPAGFSEEYVRCVEPGFANITTEALCSQAYIGSYGAVWIPEVKVCAQSRVLGDSCVPPLLSAQWTDSVTGWMYDACFVPMMSNAAALSSNTSAPVKGTLACIESDVVQNHGAVASLSVGQIFRGVDGILYAVTTGGDCAFGCTDGFDVNCDGKLGDFCAVELDRLKAADVGTCLAAQTNNQTSLVS